MNIANQNNLLKIDVRSFKMWLNPWIEVSPKNSLNSCSSMFTNLPAILTTMIFIIQFGRNSNDYFEITIYKILPKKFGSKRLWAKRFLFIILDKSTNYLAEFNSYILHHSDQCRLKPTECSNVFWTIFTENSSSAYDFMI